MKIIIKLAEQQNIDRMWQIHNNFLVHSGVPCTVKSAADS